MAVAKRGVDNQRIDPVHVRPKELGESRPTGPKGGRHWCARQLSVVLSTVLIMTCGGVRVETYSHPTVAPGWRLTGNIDLAYEVAVPSQWMTFDLQTQLDLVVTICARSELQSFRLRRATSARFGPCW